jgi:hypothetical protein
VLTGIVPTDIRYLTVDVLSSYYQALGLTIPISWSFQFQVDKVDSHLLDVVGLFIDIDGTSEGRIGLSAPTSQLVVVLEARIWGG